MLAPSHGGTGKSTPHFHTFCCRQRHHGLSQNRIELVEDGFAPPGGNIARNTGDGSADGIPGFSRSVNGLGHLLCRGEVRTANVVLIHVLRLDRLTVDLRTKGTHLVHPSDDFNSVSSGQDMLCEGAAATLLYRFSCGGSPPLANPDG